MRLNQYLALSGIGSRRACDKIIEEGRVLINGEPAFLYSRVKAQDQVSVDGKIITLKQKAYYVFYKPLFVLTTLKDPKNRPTIQSYLMDLEERVFPVGRLDFDSEGLLFLTNDGVLAHKIQHPKYEIEKEYIVKTNKNLSIAQLRHFKEGIILEEGKTAPAMIKEIKDRTYQIILHQGWHRQIRRMLAILEIETLSLKRVRIGNLTLGDLKPGEKRRLYPEELKTLRRMVF